MPDNKKKKQEPINGTLKTGIDQIQNTSKMIGKSRAAKNIVPMGSAFGLIDSFANKHPYLLSDIVGVIPTGLTQAASLVLDYAEKENENFQEFAKNKNRGKEMSELIPEKDINTRVIESTNIKKPNIYAYGGQLKNTMQNNQLTEFNEGGTHESNPNGGIPLGDNALVEQNETKKGNYIYSDRLYINEDLVKQFNLPNNIKGKTFANASKVIEKPFKDKNSNPDKATQKEHLDRLKQAQEALKAHEAQVNQSMQANSQEIPDQMNGDIPEGMEQFAEGGFFDNIAGLAQNSLGSAVPGLGVAEGVMGLGALSQGVGANKNVGSSMLGGALAGGMAGSSLGPVGIAGGIGAGLIAGGLGSGKAKKAEAELGTSNAHAANAIFRDKQVQYGVGGYIDPFKKIVGDVYNKYNNPLSQGTLDDNELTNSLVGKYKTQNPVGPVEVPINPLKDIVANAYNTYNKPLSQGTLDNNELTTKLANEFKYGKPSILKPTGLTPSARFNQQPGIDETLPTTTTSTIPGQSFLQKAGSYLKENQGELMRLAPVGMNALQLAKLKRPGQVSLNRLFETYKPGYIDEAGIQNRLDSENQNTINALTNASGGSGALLTSGILSSNLARLKARGDAYSGIRQYNNGQDAIAQNFKLGVDQANMSQSNLEMDINDRNQASYRNVKREYLTGIAENLGSIGKEEAYKKIAKEAFGYKFNGEYYVKPDGTKLTISQVNEQIEKDKNSTQNKFGGYLKKRY